VTIYRQIIARNCFRQITAAARVLVGDAQQSRARSMITLRALRHIRDRPRASAANDNRGRCAADHPQRRTEPNERRPARPPRAEWRGIEQDYVIAGTRNK